MKRRGVAWSALAVIAAARAEAQTLPRPRPVETAFEPPPRLEYALGVGAGWDAEEIADGGALVPHAAVARTFAGERGRLRLAARGRSARHPAEPALDRHEAAATAEGTHRSSETTTWTGAGSIGVGDGDQSPVALDQGLLLPAARVRTATVAAGVAHALSPRTALRLEARGLEVAFDVPSLVDTRSARATAALDRRMGGRTDASLVLAVEATHSAAGPAVFTHFASAQWTRRVSPRDALLFEAGASYTPDAERAGLDREAAAFGGAAWSRRLRHGAVSAFVRREVTPAFGAVGARSDLRGGLGADLDLGPEWRVHLAALGARGEGGAGSGVDALIAAGRRIGRSLAISAESRYRRRGPAAGRPAQETLRIGLYLTVISRQAPPIAP
jgi:hypothetical protein